MLVIVFLCSRKENKWLRTEW